MSKPSGVRQRAKKPKVKTGCVTCKLRRVKYGEEKPYCTRCTSTGRHCDGCEATPASCQKPKDELAPYQGEFNKLKVKVMNVGTNDKSEEVSNSSVKGEIGLSLR
ncbi:hypothetical protein BJ878DRAFT_123598 [Calycina marina]|uniref:Zn(2)-C6 fungal-type domain-containing protein n=1 Tax=Calycina marina TaxID=1763456 RepID=A0A9P7Z0G5_9HELO|nr:hypothetical protein BJ878DRAFT_123598 [Calycina marina]